MSQVTNGTSIAENLRLQSWAEMIRECNARPSGMKVEDWCKQYGITKHCYYYRFKRVRSRYLEQNLGHQENSAPDFALVAMGDGSDISGSSAGDSVCEEGVFTPQLTIQVNNALIGINENTPANLLAKVMEVVAYAK